MSKKAWDQIEVSVESWGEDCSAIIEYNFSGRYYPATRTDPEEYPEFEWGFISATDENGQPITDPERLKEVEENLEAMRDTLQEKAGGDAYDTENHREYNSDDKYEDNY